MIEIFEGIAVLLISYGAAYVFTMFFFWVDLEINNPETTEQMNYLKSRHLKMNKYVNLAIFIGLCIYVFF
ncbi:MAG: hypothetical protein ACOYMF_14655 [Bacteroidales bacterium]